MRALLLLSILVTSSMSAEIICEAQRGRRSMPLVGEVRVDTLNKVVIIDHEEIELNVFTDLIQEEGLFIQGTSEERGEIEVKIVGLQATVKITQAEKRRADGRRGMMLRSSKDRTESITIACTEN